MSTVNQTNSNDGRGRETLSTHGLERWLRSHARNALSRSLTAAGRRIRRLRPDLPLHVGFLLSHPYQRSYIESLLAIAEGLPVLNCSRIISGSAQSLSLPFRQKASNYDYILHSHPFQTEPFYQQDIRHILVLHGPHAGFFDELGSYSFGRGRLLTREGRRIYDRLWVTSAWDRELAENEVPEYIGRADVIGCQRRDRIFSLEAARPSTRESIGLATHEKLVLIASTHSGKTLLGEHFDLLTGLISTEIPNTKYHVIIHPFASKNHPGKLEKILSICAESRGRVQMANQSQLEESLVAADLMISDHGSLSLYYAALNRPLAFVPLKSNLLPESPLRTVYQDSRHVSDAHEAEALVRSLHAGADDSGLPEQVLRRLRLEAGRFPELSEKALSSLVAERIRS